MVLLAEESNVPFFRNQGYAELIYPESAVKPDRLFFKTSDQDPRVGLFYINLVEHSEETVKLLYWAAERSWQLAVNATASTADNTHFVVEYISAQRV